MRTLAIGCVALCTITGRADDDVAVDDVPPGAAMQQTRQNTINLDQQFDMMLASETVGRVRGGAVERIRQTPRQQSPDSGGAATASPTLANLRKIGEARLSRIESVGGVSEAQRLKLRLAMESDVRRLAEEIDSIRDQYRGVPANSATPADQRKMQQFYRDWQRVRERLTVLFDEDSLLVKILPTTLDADQRARLENATAARRTFLWKGIVAMGMLKLDDILGLDQSQHDALEKLLLDSQLPVRPEGFTNQQNDVRHSHQFLIWVALSKIDPRKLQSIMSERQATLLLQLAAQGKNWGTHATSSGLLEKESP